MAGPPQALRPMLASPSDAPLSDPRLCYEPKYDGIRAIAELGPGGRARLWSRLGNEKTAQFPEIVEALGKWARRVETPLVVDGEIVALDARDRPAGFQQLQGRIHVTKRRMSTAAPRGSAKTPDRARVAFIMFDLLRNGAVDIRDAPLVERRAALERRFSTARSPLLRLSEIARGDGHALYERAREDGWEGLVAKSADSRYRSGRRTSDWRKIKIVQSQEFVVGGWTEPRGTRECFGALLLGVFADGSKGAGRPLVCVGHTGTGLSERELARVMALMAPLETRECPFAERPRTNERAHWVRPTLVVQVTFAKWTADGRLRHPVYLGLRDDKKPETVRREHPVTRGGGAPAARADAGRLRAANEAGALIDELTALETSGRDGFLVMPEGGRLAISNLRKVFWPKPRLTKGDLLRYYVRVAPFLLPSVDGRPLVMKRLPDGVDGEAFYQQRAPDEVPDGVRVGAVSGDQSVPSRLIGGTLTTLLYMAQLAAVSQDPWFSRVETPDDADYVAFDLDPMPGVPFAQVLDVARWIHDELASLGAMGVPKTSGADGLHIYVPLPRATPYEAGLLFCQIIATVVAQKHPTVATVERSIGARGERVYVDYLQNIRGKTLATAYSARASQYAGVSTPLTWQEVDRGVRREDFTIESVPARLARVGDLWTPLRTAPGVDLSRVARYAEATHAPRRGATRPRPRR